ncbi:UDP-3-O-(3-hydroxymyristoyl)glucosamine N-acyltransferase [Olivibacter sp. SDN3]|uniref:UDP-3-O-(3-hydroxymyristoyl)glucosamine N-acyltransferase n=1 Tax=Olivibacter sp. SDN3 TaxID=2764720 RepID=UPI0016513843|nr:UDP-3-O-(3-hydroxymyristoyl)glucosamine N-acyltransferase [Olivibacter sp. SDN3]QNL51335.1 UDP-3-O-(3-hydroxymyristoyl)glucosamine N-acyltransferase [Olivibacter sp. SDN3]
MQFTAKQISEIVNGSIEGNGEVLVSRVEKIEEATEGGLTFLANPKYEHFLYTTEASVVIVNNDLEVEEPISPTLIRVKNAYTAITLLLDQYNHIRFHRTGIEEPSFIHETATLGEEIYIGAFSYIGAGAVLGDNVSVYPQVYIGDNVQIGAGTILFPGVRVYHDCVIGENVIVHSGTVIGSDGFGFAPQEDGSYRKISQIGNVVIEDNVEIGANTAIDRATMGKTIIRKGVKLDNLIQLAHNVEIGENSVIAAQSGISGSTKVGKNVVLGGQVGAVGHISIADGSQVQAQSGINRSIEEPGLKWAGTPASQFQSQMRAQVVLQRLPDLERRIDQLEKIIKNSEGKRK